MKYFSYHRIQEQEGDVPIAQLECAKNISLTLWSWSKLNINELKQSFLKKQNYVFCPHFEKLSRDVQLERVRDFYKKRDPRMGVRKGMIMMLGDGKRKWLERGSFSLSGLIFRPVAQFLKF